MRAEKLGDDQCDECLPDCGDHPQPDTDRTGGLEDGVVGGEHSHRDRDERERDREHLIRAEGSFQLWFVAAIHALVVGRPGIEHVIYRHPNT